MTQGEIYFYLKKYLNDHKWNILAGEPPDGSNDLVRMEIRDESFKEKGSKGSYKIDLVALKEGTLLLIENYRTFESKDVSKLNCIVGEKADHLFDALSERCGIERSQVKEIIKALGVTEITEDDVPVDFLVFVVSKAGIKIIKGRNLAEEIFLLF